MANKEKETEEAIPEGGEKKKSKLLLIIIIAVLVLVLIIGGVVAALMMGNHETEAETSQESKTEVATDGAEKATKSNHSNKALTEVGIMFPLDTFTVNLLSESGRRYLKVQITLEMEGKELSPELEEKKAVFRDIIIRILSSKSLEEISTIKGKETLKEQIVSELNTRLKDGKIENIYFTDFVVQ
jgi:flagellar protein FliL